MKLTGRLPHGGRGLKSEEYEELREKIGVVSRTGDVG